MLNDLIAHTTCMTIRGSVVSLRFIFLHPPEGKQNSVTVFEAAGLTVLHPKAEIMLLQTQDLASRTPPFVIEAAGQRYKSTMKFLFLDGVIYEALTSWL